MSVQQSDEFTYAFPELNPDERLRELVIYIAHQCAGDPTFGLTKLNKILYFADIEAYRQSGQPITGTEYLRQEFGPVPKTINRIRRELEQAGAIEIQEEQVLNFTRRRVVAHGDPDLTLFDNDQLALVNSVIQGLWGQRAADVSEASHGMAWQLTDDLDSIPYEAALLSNTQLEPSQLNWIEGQIEEYERARRGADDSGK